MLLECHFHLVNMFVSIPLLLCLNQTEKKSKNKIFTRKLSKKIKTTNFFESFGHEIFRLAAMYRIDLKLFEQIFRFHFFQFEKSPLYSISLKYAFQPLCSCRFFISECLLLYLSTYSYKIWSSLVYSPIVMECLI